MFVTNETALLKAIARGDAVTDGAVDAAAEAERQERLRGAG